MQYKNNLNNLIEFGMMIMSPDRQLARHQLKYDILEVEAAVSTIKMTCFVEKVLYYTYKLECNF